MRHTVPWQDGRRAWARLGAWYTVGDANRAFTDVAVVKALSDVRLVRGLLEQAEYNAVRAATAAGRPLAEIAATLGVPIDEVHRKWGHLAPPA
jgi:hypothetical protein